VLRNQVFVLDHMYMSLFSTCAWILRLAVVIALLVWIHPALALLAVLALPTVLTSTWRPGVERKAEEKGAAAGRLSQHLFRTATTAPPGKEVRVTGIGPRLVRERRETWEKWYRPVARPRPRGWGTGSAWRPCRSRTRAPRASSSTPSTSRSRRGQWWRWWARTARARPRWSSFCASSTSRPRARSSWTAPRWRASAPRSG